MRLPVQDNVNKSHQGATALTIKFETATTCHELQRNGRIICNYRPRTRYLHATTEATTTMASTQPLPIPPRTPTPPSPIPGDDQDEAAGLGIRETSRAGVPAFLTLNRNNLSPMTDTFSPGFGSMASPMPSSAGFTASPALSDTSTLGQLPAKKSPFNFQTQTMKDTPVMAKSVCHLP